MDKRFNSFFRSVQYTIQRGWPSGRPTGRGRSWIRGSTASSGQYSTQYRKVGPKEANRER